MKLQLISDMLIMAATLFGFSYGATKFFKKGKALYLQMIVGGVGSMMLGKMFETVTILTNGQLSGFHVGVLGTIGCFMFFFSANFGQMDSLVDDDSRQNGKYRLLALIAPLVIALGCIAILLGDALLETKVVCIIEAVFIMQAAYYNLKHLIIPDVEYGIIRSIRGYNFLALLYAVLSMAEMTFRAAEKMIPVLIVSIIIAVVSVAIMPVVERGVKQWTM